MPYAKIDVNSYVLVKLTEDGERILANTPDADFKRMESGWTQWMLYDLMHTFGPHSYMGAPSLFEQMRIECSGVQFRHRLSDDIRRLIELEEKTRTP